MEARIEPIREIKKDSPALGIAMKISDGDGWSRARGFLGIGILRDLGLIGDDLPAPVVELADPVIRNWKDIEVGERRALYKWNKVV